MDGSRTYFGMQFVWWDRENSESWGRPFRMLPPYPESGNQKGTIYAWRFVIGPLEVKKWGRLVDWRLTKRKGGG